MAPLAALRLGFVLAEQGDMPGAAEAYQHAIALGNASAYPYLGVALRELDRLEDALAAFNQAIALAPDNASVHCNRGYTLLCLDRFEDALAAYDQVIALDPAHACAYENRGIALAAIGDLDKALAEFDSADRLAPDSVGESRTWAGAILWHRRNPVRARDRFELVKGRVTGCTPFRAAELEAIALCGLGRPDDAEQHLRAAIPLRAPKDRFGPRMIYDLLSDPPIPGIDRLRAIVDNDT